PDIWHMVRFRNHSRFTRAYFRCLAVAGRNWMTMGILWRKEDTGNSPRQSSLSAGVVLQILWTRVTESCRNRFAGEIAAACELNADASVTVADESKDRVDLALLIVGSDAALKVADEIVGYRDVRAWVVARLDAPGKIAVIPAGSPSLPTVDASMHPGVGSRSEAADFIAMLATAEAFKLIAGYAENPSQAIIEFDSYQTRVRLHP